MANTASVDIAVDEWTEVIGVGSGFITNESDNAILYRENDSLPSSSITSGHSLNRKSEVRYELKSPFKVYARALQPMLAINKLPFVIVTPD